MKFPLATFVAVGNVPKRGHGRRWMSEADPPFGGPRITPTPNRKNDMTRHLERIFRAGLTRRWHTNAHLSGTCDRLDGHQARVARIILALWPDASRELLIAALTHDDGEYITGDIPATFGKTDDQASYEAEAYITIWGDKFPRLSYEDGDKLHFADKLDAYQWAYHHAPHLMGKPEWREAWAHIEDMAAGLGVEVGE